MITPDATSNWRHWTAAFMLVQLFVIILWDIAAEKFGGNASTITVLTRDAQTSDVVVAVLIGMLMGHLTGQLWWAALVGYAIGALFSNPAGKALLGRWGLIK